jgi:hypothetical protein
MSTTASIAGGGGGVTKVHWGRVGGMGVFVGGLLLFVVGIVIGGEGEHLIERQRMERVIAHEHDLSVSTSKLRDELENEKEQEQQLKKELQAEHERAAKLELLSRGDERIAVTTTATTDVLGELKALLAEPDFDAPSHWGAVGPFEITVDIGRPCTVSAVTLDWHVSAEPKTYRVSVAMPTPDGSSPVQDGDDWMEAKEYGETQPEPDMIRPKHVVHEIQIGMFYSWNQPHQLTMSFSGRCKFGIELLLCVHRAP